MTAPVLDVVVPVHTEQHTVAACVRRLHAHLVHTFPYPLRITVADNASTDATAQAAASLAAELPGVAVARLPQKGRGRALKQVWLASDAPILAYMDVDLSTDLDALWPLVAPLMSGHSDVSIGSRLHRDARVVRGARREAISRCYNLLLRVALGARSLASGSLPVTRIAERIGRHGNGGGLGRQVVRFAGVGVVSTVVHLGLFALLRLGVESAQAANLVALLLATVVNTALNRRWTFGVRGPERRARQHAMSLGVFAVTLLLTSCGLGLLHLWQAAPPTWLETAAVAAATACSTLVRFVAMRRWIFRTATEADPHDSALRVEPASTAKVGR